MKVSGDRKSSSKIRNTTTTTTTTTQKPLDSGQKIDEQTNPTISGTLRELFIETWIFHGNNTNKYTNILAIEQY